MKSVIYVLLAAGCGAFAQPRPGPSFGSFANTLPPAGRVAATPGHVLAPPPVQHSRHGRTAVVPYPVFYTGGYYGYDVPPAAYAQPNGTQPQDDQQQQSPVVIINQNFRPDPVNPVVHDYSNTPLPEPTFKRFEEQSVVITDAQPTIYLIAMRDHTIFPALAYWVEGDTLNYITSEGSHNRATLDLVDRDFSRQLNDERHVPFKLK